MLKAKRKRAVVLALIAQAAADGYSGIPDASQAAAYEANLALQKGLDDQVATIKSAKSKLASAWSDALSAEVGNGLSVAGSAIRRPVD